MWSKLIHLCHLTFLNYHYNSATLSCLRTIVLFFLDNFSAIFQNFTWFTNAVLCITYISYIFLNFLNFFFQMTNFIIWDFICIAHSALKEELRVSVNNIFPASCQKPKHYAHPLSKCIISRFFVAWIDFLLHKKIFCRFFVV